MQSYSFDVNLGFWRWNDGYGYGMGRGKEVEYRGEKNGGEWRVGWDVNASTRDGSLLPVSGKCMAIVAMFHPPPSLPLHPFLSASLVFPAEKKFSFHRESWKASFKVSLAPLGANNNNNNTRWYIPLPRLQLYDIRSNFLSEFYLFPPSSLIQCFSYF